MHATLPHPRAVRPPTEAVGRRWRLGRLIGRGAHGSVWSATDPDTGAEAAVKLVPTSTDADDGRARREIAALRLLRAPGVVGLLDAGAADGWHWIAMERVDGAPFPGAARGWTEIRPLVARLLETLRFVHAHGVVHRDLKPSNVLVEPGGRVVVLDFGVARGRSIGETLTATADVVGTPMYLAPEQLGGDGPVDGRADLYAVGVLLYEAISGRVPFPGHDAREVALSRLVGPPPPLRGVPDRVSAAIVALLAPHAADRPSSADEALAALGIGSGGRSLPWIGSRATVDALVAAARDGRSLDVAGPSGSGRTRTLAEAAAVLRGEGAEVIEVPAGGRPLQSLAAVFGPPDPSRATEDAARRLDEALARGAVVVVDAGLDRWSADVVDRARARGAILRAHAGPDAVRTRPLGPGDLAALFHGPDIVLHLREDASAALYRRTGGVAARVQAEVDAWVARGGATWDGDALRVTRASIDAFAAGAPMSPPRVGVALDAVLDEALAWIALAGGVEPDVLATAMDVPRWEVDALVDALVASDVARVDERGRVVATASPGGLARWTPERRADAHRAVALALPEADDRRIPAFVAAEDADEAVGAAMAVARDALARGEARRAFAALELALAGVGRDAPSGAWEQLALAALVDGDGASLKAAKILLERGGAAGLTDLVGGWALAGDRQYDEASALADRVPPLADVDLEGWRRALPVRIAVATDAEDAERKLQALDLDESSAVARRRTEWWGQLRFRQRRFAEAAQIQRGVAGHERSVARRCTAWVNAGLAHRDEHEYQQALEAFGRARDLAGSARMVVLEAHACVGLRSVRYRMGEYDGVDVALLAAVEAIDQPALAAPAFLNEAAVAWRRGDRRTEELARRAAACWSDSNTRIGYLLATALASVAAGSVEEARAVAAEVKFLRPVVGAWQVGALCVLAGVPASEIHPRIQSLGIEQDGAEAVLTMREMHNIVDGGRLCFS